MRIKVETPKAKHSFKIPGKKLCSKNLFEERVSMCSCIVTGSE
jgi:hypothetical protein